MIIVSGTLRLLPDDLAALRDVARATIEATRAESGCIVYSFADDLTEPGLVRIYEEWEDRVSLEAHGNTAHIATWREALARVKAQGAQLQLIEIASTEPFS